MIIWAYLLAGALILSTLTGVGGYFKGKAEQRDEYRTEQAQKAEEQVVLDRAAALRTFQLQKERDDENLRTADRLVTALGQLRSRPERMPAASAPACIGGDGAGLSGPDASFLAGEAARANKLRTDLETCKAWIAEAVALTKPK